VKKLPHDTGAAVGGTAMISKEHGRDPGGSNRDVILGTIPGLSHELQRNTTQNISQGSDKSWSSLRSACHPPDTSSLLGANIFPAIVIIDVICTELTILWGVTLCSLVENVKICFLHHRTGRRRGFLRNIHAVN